MTGLVCLGLDWSVRCKMPLLFSSLSMSEPKSRCPMWIYVRGVSLSVWPVPIDCLYRNVRWHVLQDCVQFHQCKLDFKYTCLKRFSILCVCQKIWKLNFHLVYLLSFVMNFLLSNSFLLQNGSWMPIFVLSSNQWNRDNRLIVSCRWVFKIVNNFINEFGGISRSDERLFNSLYFFLPNCGYSFCPVKCT